MSNSSASLAENIRNIPPVTRFFTIFTIIVCFAHALKLTNLGQLTCYMPQLLGYLHETLHQAKHLSAVIRAYLVLKLFLQSYRFFSCFLLPMGLPDQPFQALLDIYFFYTFANDIESRSGKFRRNFPDCLWFTIITATLIHLLSFVYGFFIDFYHFPVYHQMLLSCVTYIWSRSLKNTIINFLGLVPIKAYYLPLFNLFFKLMLNGYSSFLDTAIGIFSGYLYQCWQSDTIPIYNLFPGSYASFLTFNADKSGRRVGTSSENSHFSTKNLGSVSENDWIDDSIFDKGYLKAPAWLYKLLDYPIGTSKRTTGFDIDTTRPKGLHASTQSTETKSATGKSTSYSWFGSGSKSAFVGKGYRLGN